MLDALTHKTTDANFYVESKPVYYWAETHGYRPICQYITNKKVLLREDTEQYLATVGDKYSVIQNNDLLDSVHTNLREAFGKGITGFADNEVDVKVSTKNAGVKTYIEYSFPDMAESIETTNGHKTTMRFRTIIENSFDSSGSVKLYTGNIDMYCTNGMIVGEYALIQQRHRGKIDIPSFADKLRVAMEQYTKNIVLYQQMAQTELHHTPYEMKSKLLDTIIYGEDEEKRPETSRLSNHIWRLARDEKVKRGDNIYSIMSALTSYAKNGINNKPSTPTQRYQREQKVNKWMQTPAWNEMLDYFDLKRAA